MQGKPMVSPSLAGHVTEPGASASNQQIQAIDEVRGIALIVDFLIIMAARHG